MIETPINQLANTGIPRFAEAVSRVRQNMVQRKAGFDGVFGKITVYNEEKCSAENNPMKS